MGVLVNFISHTVVIGFTAGRRSADRGEPDQEFLRHQHSARLLLRNHPQLFLQIGSIDPYVTAVAAVTLASGILVKKFLPVVPYMIAAMLIGSFFALGLDSYTVTKSHIFAPLVRCPLTLPPFSFPDLSFATIKKMAPTPWRSPCWRSPKPSRSHARWLCAPGSASTATRNSSGRACPISSAAFSPAMRRAAHSIAAD